jgi:hypothetical protein
MSETTRDYQLPSKFDQSPKWELAQCPPPTEIPIIMMDKDNAYHVGVYTTRCNMGFVSVRKGKKKGSVTLDAVDGVVKWMAIPK